MQQLNSLYRGDQSESLGQIMGGQYAPQTQLNSFTGNWAISGMQGAGATQRTAMQLASQEGMQKRQLGQQADQFSLTHALNLGNQDLAAQAQQFGQQRDVATFGQTGARDAAAAKYQQSMSGAANITADATRNNSNTSAYATMVAPGEARKQKLADEVADAAAGWDMHNQEIDALLASPDNAKYSASLNAWKEKINSWKTGTNSAGYLRAFRASRLSNPQMLLGTAAEPTNTFTGN